MSRLTNNMIEAYLSDCLGYDELMIEEIKENYEEDFVECLSEKERRDCLEYNGLEDELQEELNGLIERDLLRNYVEED